MPSGIFITKGMTVHLPAFSLRIGADGSVESDPVTLHLHFDVCPTWIRVAMQHLEAARDAKAKRERAWKGEDSDLKAQCLEAEFEASMQAIVSAVTAWDAAYAVLREHVSIPPSLVDRWRKRRTSRYSQVAEVVRRAFVLNPRGAKALRANLKEIYRYRDLAVHPSGKVKPALLHPEIGQGVEWRFVFFRATNADLAVSVAAAMLWDLAINGKTRNPAIAKYQEALATRLREIFPEGQPIVPNSSKPIDAA